MARTIRLNAFCMNSLGHTQPGSWTHPREQSYRYKDIEYWIEFAQLLERGLFDGVFIADGLGVNDVYRGSAAPTVKYGAAVPHNDALQVVPVMATATRHLSFGITCSVNFEYPYSFARRMSTLDHLTKGRAAWNIVTSYLESGARNMGMTGNISHDERYDIADEYMDVCYKLWEGSWEDDAVVMDRDRGVYAEPTKVHPIDHEGKYFRVPGIHLSEPSPQRTPVLYQAGASSRGMRFAAKHAECVFTASPTRAHLRNYVKDLRQAAAEQGRDPSKLKVFNGMIVIVAETDGAARALIEEYRKYINEEAVLAMICGFLGVDLSKYPAEAPLENVKSNAIISYVNAVTQDPTRKWTVGELARSWGIGGLGMVMSGSPSTVADQMQSYLEETDSDGFNIGYIVQPENFRAIVDLLVPELQHRGIYKSAYEIGSYRHKLFGTGDRLAHGHPGTRFRTLGPSLGTTP